MDAEERRCAYLHLYGVAQACAMLALKRNENAELAIIAGMLHDIYSYTNMDSKRFGRKENNPLPSKEDNWIIRVLLCRH